MVVTKSVAVQLTRVAPLGQCRQTSQFVRRKRMACVANGHGYHWGRWRGADISLTKPLVTLGGSPWLTRGFDSRRVAGAEKC